MVNGPVDVVVNVLLLAGVVEVAGELGPLPKACAGGDVFGGVTGLGSV